MDDTMDIDSEASAAVARSLSTSGDYSSMTREEKAALYLSVSKALGLDPRMAPLAFITIDGREVLYANKGATDQLARVHRVTRTVTDGPKIITIETAGGRSLALAYCQVEASLADGRRETDIGTVPVFDPANAMMHAITKAKRRATLAILGLGMLDVAEVADVAAAAPDRIKTERQVGDTREATPRAEVPRGVHVVRDDAAPRPADEHDAPAPAWIESLLLRLAAIDTDQALVDFIAREAPDASHEQSAGWLEAARERFSEITGIGNVGRLLSELVACRRGELHAERTKDIAGAEGATAGASSAVKKQRRGKRGEARIVKDASAWAKRLAGLTTTDQAVALYFEMLKKFRDAGVAEERRQQVLDSLVSHGESVTRAYMLMGEKEGKAGE